MPDQQPVLQTTALTQHGGGVAAVERSAFQDKIRHASVLEHCEESTACGNAMCCKGVILHRTVRNP